MSRRSVEYILETPPQFTSGACAYFARISLVISQNLCQSRRINSRISACFAQRRKNIFRRDVADQIVSRKGASAKSRQRAVESPASRFVRRENLFFRILRPAVQVYAQFDSRDVILHVAKQSARRVSGVAFPAVSASETVRTRISFSHSSVSCTISAPQGSSYGLPNAIEM